MVVPYRDLSVVNWEHWLFRIGPSHLQHGPFHFQLQMPGAVRVESTSMAVDNTIFDDSGSEATHSSMPSLDDPNEIPMPALDDFSESGSELLAPNETSNVESLRSQLSHMATPAPFRSHTHPEPPLILHGLGQFQMVVGRLSSNNYNQPNDSGELVANNSNQAAP